MSVDGRDRSIVVLLCIHIVASESPFACLSTTVRLGNGLPYYEVVNVSMTYEEAETECRTKGAELYTVRAEDEQIQTQNISTSWLSAKRRYWTHDKLDLGLAYESWAEDEPKTGPDRCVVASRDGTTIKLVSASCSNQYDILCMNQKLGSCNGEHVYNYFCYFIPEGVSTPKTFTEASRICSDQFGYLLSVFNQQQLDWLNTTFQHTFWTGYKYNESSTDFYLYDGSRVTYTNWQQGQPARGDCVVISQDGKWQTSQCDNTNTFLCILEVPYATKNVACNDYGNECVCYWKYFVWRTYDEAMEYCMSDGGTLVYANNQQKVDYLISKYNENLWLGLSEGHTPGVWRGTDGCVFSWSGWYYDYPAGGQHCAFLYPSTGIYSSSCQNTKYILCQSIPDPYLYPCRKRSGCLRTLDYWHVEDPDVAYTGPASLTIQHVSNFELCWDMCVSYIGFECLVVAYNETSKECALSPDSSGSWEASSTLQSRNRTRRISDVDSYCTETLQSATFTEAHRLCSNYKTGWAIPVIRDVVMLEELSKLLPTHFWISAIEVSPGTYKTLEDEYLPFSKFDIGEPDSSFHNCITSFYNMMYGSSCDYMQLVVCISSKYNICRHFPNITYGSSIQDNETLDVVYTCNDNYFMPTLNTSSFKLNCSCDWTNSIEQLENCTAIRCPQPTDSDNGTVVEVFGLEINQTVQYRCPFGYQVSETGSIYFNLTCTRLPHTTTAVWSSFPLLETMKCNSIRLVYNATYTADDNSVGSEMQIICDDGFRIANTTNNTINTTCVIDNSQLIADWCWTPPCQEIFCLEPIAVDMATYILHGNKTGDNVTYTCDRNYKINGTATNTTNATCGFDDDYIGVWLNVPSCEAVTCPEAPFIDNVSNRTSPTDAVIGDLATYRCNYGFLVHKDGVQVDNEITFNMTCQVDYDHFIGQWIGNFTCEVAECGEPPTPDNASLYERDRKLNSVINYTCDANFIINSTGTKWTLSTCLLGDDPRFPFWTTIDKCSPIICNTSYTTNASLVEETGNMIGDVRYYRCPLGWRVNNSEPATATFSISCELDDDQLAGRWTKPPLCTAVTCDDPPAVPNAEVTVQGLNIDDTALYRCDAGYAIDIPYLTSFCVLDEKNEAAAVWQPVPQCLEEQSLSYVEPLIRQCPPPDAVVGATAHYKHLFINEPVSYAALPGYTFDPTSKVRTSVCQTGSQWSVQVPDLTQITCPPLPKLPEATKSTDSNVYGTEVKIECNNPDAKMENGLSSVTFRCSFDGKWTFITRKCDRQRCGPFPMVKHSSLVAYNNTVGETAVLKCHTSYRFEDGQQIKSFQCLPNLQWEEPKQCYLNTCPPLPVPKNGNISTDLALEETEVEVKCLPGFMFPDRSRTKLVSCNSTFHWTEELTDCQDVTCPEPPEITNGMMTATNTSYNSTISYICEESYRLEYGYTELTIRCEEDGQWTYNTLSCALDRCRPIPVIENAVPNTTLALNGTTVEYTCDRGFVFSTHDSVMYIYCNGLHWNSTETACTPIRCPELNLIHATWTDTGRYFGDDIVHFRCDEGFIYDNNTTGVLQCQDNGQWNGDTTGCQPIDCGLPADVQYATRNLPQHYGYGTSITYTCLPNYWFQRGQVNKTIDCSRYGVWSEIPGDCIPITCPPIPVWDDMEANSTDNTVGSVVNVTCLMHGTDTKPFAISVCTQRGEWQPDLETCTSVQLSVFEPEIEEAEGSSAIGVFVLATIAVIFVAMIISDIPVFVQAIRGRNIRLCS